MQSTPHTMRSHSRRPLETSQQSHRLRGQSPKFDFLSEVRRRKKELNT